MNNLKSLRKEANLSIRALEEKTKISISVLNYLENGTRPFRQSHIDTLTSFFNVTSDYLLGRSDNGFIVRPQYGDEEILLTANEYTHLCEYISISIIKVGGFDIDLTSSKEAKHVVQSDYVVYRELKGNMEDYDMKSTLSIKLQELTKKMTKDDIRKTIKFIEEYIFR